MTVKRLKPWHWRTGLVAVVVVALGTTASLMPWPAVWEAMRAANKALLLMAVALNIAVFPFWVWQWRLIARPFAAVGWRAMAGVVALSIAAKATLSGLAGVSSGLLALRYRAGLTYSQSSTVMSVDQVFALVTKGLVVTLALGLLPLAAILGQAAVGLGVLAVLALGAVMLARRLGHSARPRVPEVLRRFLRDLGSLGSVPLLAGGLVLALLKKALEIGAALAVQLACGIDASPAAAVLVVAAVSLTTLVPIVPANLGTHSAGVFAAYALLEVPGERALAAGLLHHAALLVASGMVVLLGLWMARR